MHYNLLKLILSAMMGIFLVSTNALAEQSKQTELVIGTIGNNVSKKTKNFAPLARYLQQHLAKDGVASVRTRVVPTSEAMANDLLAGKIDIALDSPLVAAKIAKLSGAKPVLRHWKKGIAEYYSVIVVPVASELKSLKDLKGKRIAFQERDSTSGFMLPVDMILSAGAPMIEKRRPQDSYETDKVNYYFSGSDRHTITWLAKGWVEAAGTDVKTFKRLEKARPGKFKILAKSITVPRHVVLQSTATDDAIGKSVAKILIDMDKSEEGQKILHGFKKTKKFDVFPDGSEETFKPIYAIIERLAAHDLF